jgi:hypothetical protein
MTPHPGSSPPGSRSYDHSTLLAVFDEALKLSRLKELQLEGFAPAHLDVLEKSSSSASAFRQRHAGVARVSHEACFVSWYEQANKVLYSCRVLYRP